MVASSPHITTLTCSMLAFLIHGRFYSFYVPTITFSMTFSLPDCPFSCPACPQRPSPNASISMVSAICAHSFLSFLDSTCPCDQGYTALFGVSSLPSFLKQVIHSVGEKINVFFEEPTILKRTWQALHNVSFSSFSNMGQNQSTFIGWCELAPALQQAKCYK